MSRQEEALTKNDVSGLGKTCEDGNVINTSRRQQSRRRSCSEPEEEAV